MSAYSGSFSGSFSGSYIGNGSQLTGVDYYTLSQIPRTITSFELNSIVANSNLRNTFTSSIKTTLNAEGVISSSVQMSASIAAAGFGTAGAVLNVLWGDIAEKPAGLMSSSAQTVTNLIGTSISASSFSGSYYGDGSNLTGITLPPPQFGSLSFAVPITWDVNTHPNATILLTSSSLLANPTNTGSGGTYNLIVTQDTTGSRTLTYGSAYKWPGGTAPTLSTATSSVDIITFIYDGTNLYGSSINNFS
jgi:hypothetical protein